MSHCINVILVKKEYLKKEIGKNITQVELPKDIVAFPSITCAKTSEVFGIGVYFLLVSTDYFGGFGEQYSTLYATTENGYETITVYRGSNPINDSLKEYGIISDENSDEFDTINLGQYRNMEDFGISFGEDNSSYEEESDKLSNVDNYFDDYDF